MRDCLGLFATLLDQRIVRGWLVVVCLCLMGQTFAQTPSAPRRSGFEQMSHALQVMQKDDAQNPAMLFVAAGARHWNECSQCHGRVEESMNGVAARFPKFNVAAGLPLTLAQQVNHCRQTHAKLKPWPTESESMLQLTALIGLQSRGQPISPDQHVRSKEHARLGEFIYQQRRGQLELSCAQCHDQRAGFRLGGSVIPQGHPTGYPIYRSEWQNMGSLQRRLRGCFTGVRAKAFESDAIEWTQLELYLMQRAQGMSVETPAVRP
jgi:L-cysteine S-thiosulfotransferase